MNSKGAGKHRRRQSWGPGCQISNRMLKCTLKTEVQHEAEIGTWENSQVAIINQIIRSLINFFLLKIQNLTNVPEATELVRDLARKLKKPAFFLLHSTLSPRHSSGCLLMPSPYSQPCAVPSQGLLLLAVYGRGNWSSEEFQNLLELPEQTKGGQDLMVGFSSLRISVLFNYIASPGMAETELTTQVFTYRLAGIMGNSY